MQFKWPEFVHFSASLWPNLLYLILSVSAIIAFLSLIIRDLERKLLPIAKPLRTIRSILVPTATLLYCLNYIVEYPPESRFSRIVQTLLWIELLWITLSLVETTVFSQASKTSWRSRVPTLLLDLGNFTMIVVGAFFIIAGVWNRDLSGFFATLGIGSIVLGFALQDTLGNLMAGIALLIERPFFVGDWVKIGETIGEVIETNWRAVRIRTRSLDTVIVPNSVLGKEKIHNFSTPTPLHAVELEVGYSYDDPPNKVKRVLYRAALETHDVLTDQPIVARTRGYKDFYINYLIKFHIVNYARLPDIEEEFLTVLWYLTRRNKLTIPFPIRTIYKTEVPPEPVKKPAYDIFAVLRKIPLFSSLTNQELEVLAADTILLDFGKGEPLVTQGDQDDTLYVILSGKASVTSHEVKGTERSIATLGAGDFFGEMALLTGEPRSATITAAEDMEVIEVHRETLKNLLTERPSLAEEFATIVSSRREGLRNAIDTQSSSAEAKQEDKEQVGILLGRIKRFFGV